MRRARPLGSGCPGFRWPVPGQALPGPCHGSAFQRRFRIFRLEGPGTFPWEQAFISRVFPGRLPAAPL